MTIHRTWHTLITLTIWNFNSLFRVCLIFYTYDSANLKSTGITPWKKMLPSTALALLITGCAQQTLTVQNKPAAVCTKGNHHPSFLLLLELGRRKLVDAAKICGGAENKKKQKPSKTFVNDYRFYYLGIYTPLEARVLLTHCTSCPSIVGNSICTAH